MLWILSVSIYVYNIHIWIISQVVFQKFFFFGEKAYFFLGFEYIEGFEPGKGTAGRGAPTPGNTHKNYLLPR
jgi:hypothetical protein